MIVAGEHGDLIAASYRARSANRRDDSFRTCSAKRRALHARHTAKQLSHFSCQGGLGANFKALLHLLTYGTDHKIGPVAKQNGAKAVGHVDVFIAVDIPKS